MSITVGSHVSYGDINDKNNVKHMLKINIKTKTTFLKTFFELFFIMYSPKKSIFQHNAYDLAVGLGHTVLG